MSAKTLLQRFSSYMNHIIFISRKGAPDAKEETRVWSKYMKIAVNSYPWRPWRPSPSETLREGGSFF